MIQLVGLGWLDENGPTSNPAPNPNAGGDVTMTQGRLQGGSGRNLRPNWGQGGRELHPEGERIPPRYMGHIRNL